MTYRDVLRCELARRDFWEYCKLTARRDRRHREEIDEYISDEIRKKIRHRNLRGGAK